MSDYNGWTNYETWVVNLWMSNDEALYAHWRGTAEQVEAESETHKEALLSFASLLGSSLRNSTNWHAELVKLGSGGMYSDLLGSAIDNVNTHEIAEQWIEDEEAA